MTAAATGARAERWWLWAGVTFAVTVALLYLRPELEKTHIALVYLLLVLAGSARAGYRVGLALSVVSFLLFDWFFVPPYNTLFVRNTIDWFVLATFLIVSVVAARLLFRLQREADAARQRAAEIDHFAALGAETLSVARAGDALSAIAGVIRSTLGIAACHIHLAPGSVDAAPPPAGMLVSWVAAHGLAALRLDDDTTRLTDATELGEVPLEHAREAYLPLRVRQETVGVLELTGEGGLMLSAAQRRFVEALGYYAALAVERMRLEAAADRAASLREADRLKSALLASVSHDLRTPLTTIKALAHELAPDGRAVVIEEEADRLNRLVADLLDLSRLQGGALPVAAELNAVDDLVGAALQRVSHALGGRVIRTTLADGGTMLVGRFDLAASVRVVVNLLENAHRFAPTGTPIDIEARRDGAMIAVSVADRGPGVPDPDRERIFEPFVRGGDGGARPDVGGAGLGLAIARGLAEAQGGTLRYRPRPGGGAEFTLSLAAADLPASLPI